MSPRSPSAPRHRTQALPAGEDEGWNPQPTPVHGVPVLDGGLVQRSPAEAAAMVDAVASASGVPAWVKLAGVPAMVLLMAGLLTMEQRQGATRERLLHAELKLARDAQTEDRKEFVKAFEKHTDALVKHTSAIEALGHKLDRSKGDRR